MESIDRKHLLELYHDWAGEEPADVQLIPESGSYRRYFRIKSPNKQAIGAFYDNPPENRAFIQLSRHFKKNGLNVPGIYAVSKEQKHYLLQDLGDDVLFDYIKVIRQKEGFSEKLVKIYQEVIDHLLKFQMVAGPTVDFSVCYPSTEFDGQAYMWDLNYFKYNFLKLAQIPYDEYKLEEDFRKLVQILLSVENAYFVYRDFQARNIMMYKNQLYFIDYQGGRKGPLHYDLVSLLFQARAEIPVKIRERLIDYYIEQAAKIKPESVQNFRQYFYRFALIRVVQTLGAYGFRGLYEKKRHFIESIPKAIENLGWLLKNNPFVNELSELKKCLVTIIEWQELSDMIHPPLRLKISSFSYKRGIPADLSGHGGGFVFDCRGLPNPGRYLKYQHMNGNSPEVIDYLIKFREVKTFISHAEAMVRQSVKSYTQRSFTDLSVSFGCTGGRHRSVYCAEQLAKNLIDVPGVKITLKHHEQAE